MSRKWPAENIKFHRLASKKGNDLLCRSKQVVIILHMHASGTACWFCTLIRAGDYLRLHLEPFRLFHPPKISTNAAVLLLHLSHIFWNLPIPFQTIKWWLLRLDWLWPLQIDSSSIISLWGWTRSHISSRGTFDLSGAAGKKKLSKHIFSFFFTRSSTRDLLEIKELPQLRKWIFMDVS